LNQEAFGEILTMLGAEEVDKRDRNFPEDNRWTAPTYSSPPHFVPLHSIGEVVYYKSNLGIGVEKVTDNRSNSNKTYLYAAPLNTNLL